MNTRNSVDGIQMPSSDHEETSREDDKYNNFLQLIAPVRSTTQHSCNLSAFDDAICVELDVPHSKLQTFIERADQEYEISQFYV
jgi:hypothetical protein